MPIKKMAILNGSTISNVAIWDGVAPWSPSSTAGDITGRIYLGTGHTYAARATGPYTKNVIIDGNSLAAQYRYATNGIEAGLIQAGLTAGDIFNNAFSGRTTNGAIQNAFTNVDAFYDSQCSKNLLIFWEGTNDLHLLGLSAAQAYANIKTYCVGRRKAGFQVLVATILPRTGESANQETRRIDLNTMLRTAIANNETWLNGIIDVGADATLGNIATCADTSIYYDGTHLTVAGHALLAPIFRDAVSPFL
jgi:lysophospholipase L1-like esterase